MEQHAFPITKTARFYTIGNASSSTKHIWICLHGYGQLAVWFARNFNQLQNNHRLFVVPEGPHRFYLQGTEGRVGASWMTKEDRLTDIKDQFNYLENLARTVQESVHETCTLNVFGFSQGVAAATRWLAQSTLQVNALVCWAGSFPLDIDYSQKREQFSNLNLQACFGDDDPYIPLEKAQALLEELKSEGVSIQSHFYSGEHKIYKGLLGDVIAQCEG